MTHPTRLLLRLRPLAALVGSIFLCAAAHAQDFPRPRGIYLLGNLGQSTPDANVIAQPFVDGFTMRILWSTVEPTRDGYDFAAIDAALASLAPFGGQKKLTLELFAREPPDWLLAEPGVQTYVAQAIGNSNGSTVTLPLPWDAFALTRWEALTGALAAHTAFDPATGTPVPLAQHSLLAQIDAGIPGLGGIRDQGDRLVDSPAYDRALLVPAIVRAVNAVEDRFPRAYPFLLAFGMNDGQSPALTTAIFDALRAEFYPGGQPPRLGLFKENFSCSQPSGLPSDPLYIDRANTFILLQALQSWITPFVNAANTDACLVFDPPQPPDWQTGNNQVDNVVRRTAISGPEVGMLNALSIYGTLYFELYRDDLNYARFADEFQAMHDLIWAGAAQSAASHWTHY